MLVRDLGSSMFTLKVERDSPTAAAEVGPKTPVQVWLDLRDEVRAYGFAGPHGWSMEWPGLATFRFGRALGSTVEVVPEPGVSLMRLEDLYRRSVLPLAFQALGKETLHASAVRLSAGVVAFCGERGAGKSTVAYGLYRRGFEQRADDTLVLSIASHDIRTFPLAFTPRLRPLSAEFFGTATPTDDYLVPSDENRTSEPLAAVFVLLPAAHAPQEPIIERLTPPNAFRAALAHAHCFDTGNPDSRRRLLENYLELAACVPVFHVTYRPGIQALAVLLDAILAAAGEPVQAGVGL